MRLYTSLVYYTEIALTPEHNSRILYDTNLLNLLIHLCKSVNCQQVNNLTLLFGILILSPLSCWQVMTLERI